MQYFIFILRLMINYYHDITHTHTIRSLQHKLTHKHDMITKIIIEFD